MNVFEGSDIRPGQVQLHAGKQLVLAAIVTALMVTRSVSEDESPMIPR